MADSYGWTGKVLRVDLSTGVITTESTDKYKSFIGGTGMGWKVLWDEVPPGVGAFDPENRLVFSVGPVTGAGSPCSGRTSITSLWPVAFPELPAAGHMGGHWGPELKYAGFDGVILQGASKNADGSVKPVWLRIEDGKVTLEDAWEIWGTGIYRSTAYINNLMGTEAHVACIGQAGENQVRMAAVFCDRSHRAGGVGGIMGSKGLKAIGVRGTGAVKIAADKKTWKELNQYYLSLMGANNQCVVARELQPWSEFSPGGTRWSGRRGVTWGAASPPIDLGTCPDVEHPTTDAPNPINKIGLRTQKGFNDYGAEGMRRTVKMDGCHSCPIRCHIAADHPELQSYGVSRYNMNTCMGNGGAAWYTNTAGSNPVSNNMMLAYMANNLEGDYGIWNDYGGWFYTFKWAYSTNVVVDAYNPATIPDPNDPTQTIPNPDIGKKVLQKYMERQVYTGLAATVAGVASGSNEWVRLRTTTLAGSGASPLTLLDNGDPRWLQFILPEVAMPKTGATYADGSVFPKTLGYHMGLGPPRLMELWPELKAAMDTATSLHQIKFGHTSHHGVESQAWIGAMVNVISAVRDANQHTHHNFYTNGLPNSASNPLQRQIAQEIATLPSSQSLFAVEDRSGNGEWVYELASDLPLKTTPMNAARASFIAQSVVMYEVQNNLTECNYTLPVWASPLKSRNYRGDPTLSAKVFSAVTGQETTQADLERMGLRAFTLLRVLTALYMQHWHGVGAAIVGAGENLRDNFDQLAKWCFKENGTTTSSTYILPSAEFGNAKDLVYDAFGWDRATGLPTQQTLNELGLGDCIAKLEAAGITVPA